MHSWNLFQWMAALGIKRREQPEIVGVVQPVEIVGDHSAFASPLLIPSAWAGGTRAAFIGAFPCLQITSRAPGGTAVRDLTVAAAADGDWGFWISNTPVAFANVVVPAVSDMAPDPTTSEVRLGTLAAVPVGNHSIMHFAALLLNRAFVDSIYIRPGYTFQLWGPIVNQAFSAAVYFEDFPAQPSER